MPAEKNDPMGEREERLEKLEAARLAVGMEVSPFIEKYLTDAPFHAAIFTLADTLAALKDERERGERAMGALVHVTQNVADLEGRE